MIPEIFDIQDSKVVINSNCLTVPELKAVNDAYEDPIPAFSYLYHKYYPKSPYCNVPEEDKEEILLADFPGDYTLEDPVMLAAIEKLEFLTMTPTYRYYLDNKFLLEKLGKFGRQTAITTGKDGNLSAFNMQVKFTGKTIQEFKQLEKIVQQEIDEYKSRVRGGKKLSYDQTGGE